MLKDRKQIVLPESLHNIVFVELHQKMGHLGSDRVEELSRQRFYWPCMRSDIEDFIRRKCPCVANKKPNRMEEAPLIPIESSYPFELVCIDYVKLDPCKGGFKYALVVTDHFTRFSQAYATKNKNSLSADRKLYDEYVMHFGFPARIHSDQGGEFTSDLLADLNKLAGIETSRTTPYHPMGNGKAERFNRTLINMLKSIPKSEKKNWKDHLSKLCFAYNSTVNRATNFSPFFLMFGRQSRLPIDCVLPVEEAQTANKSHAQFVRDWQKSMKEAFQLANEHAQKSASYNKAYYDSRIKEVELVAGDKVLLKNHEKGGTGKLRSFWEEKFYILVEKEGSMPVYVIKPVNGRKTKTVHRNLLLKVNDLPLNSFGQTDKNPIVKRKQKSPVKSIPKTVYVDSSSSDSDGVVIEYPEYRFPEGEGVPEREIQDDLEPDRLESEVQEVLDAEIEDDQLEYAVDQALEVSGSEDSVVFEDIVDAGPGSEEEEEITVPYEEDVTLPYELEEENLSDMEGTVVEPQQSSNGHSETEDTELETSAEYQSARDTSVNIDSSSSDSDDSPSRTRRFEALRRSSRARQERRLFGYDKPGGKPKYSRVKRYSSIQNINKM